MEGKRTLREEQVCTTSATQCPRGAASKWQRLPRPDSAFRLRQRWFLLGFQSATTWLSFDPLQRIFLSTPTALRTFPVTPYTSKLFLFPSPPTRSLFFLGFSTKPSSLGEYRGFPGVSALKNPPAVRKKTRVRSLDGKIPWRRERQSSPLFWSGKSYGQRSLAEDSLWGLKELDTTEWLKSDNNMLWDA